MQEQLLNLSKRSVEEQIIAWAEVMPLKEPVYALNI